MTVAMEWRDLHTVVEADYLTGHILRKSVNERDWHVEIQLHRIIG